MTYREHIQKLIEEAEGIYDSAGGLRDHAFLNEKETWNSVRTLSRSLSSLLRALDDRLDDKRAADTV